MSWIIEKLWNRFYSSFFLIEWFLCICVRKCAAPCVCSHCPPEWHRVKRSRKWDEFLEAIHISCSMPHAFYLSNCLPPHLPAPQGTLAHLYTHSFTHPYESIHPSLWHDCSSLVTLCYNPSALSKNGNYTGPLMQLTDRVRIMAWCITANCH